MPVFQIEVTEEANGDLAYYTVFERKVIAGAIRAQLIDQPMTETTNRKQLRDNPIATWELRVGKYRVFYEVDEPELTVTVIAIGHKIHNKLLIRGKEVQL